MKIDIAGTRRAASWEKFSTDLAKATASAVPLLVAAQPGALAGAISVAMPFIIDAAVALSGTKDTKLGSSAWALVRAAYSSGLARFIANAPLARRPEGAELRELIAALQNRLELLIEQVPQELSADAFYSPLKIPALRRLAKEIPHEMRLYNIDATVSDSRKLFEECLVEGFSDYRNARSAEFIKIEAALSGPFADATEKRHSLARHYQFLFQSFSQRPIFGQEGSGITLSDLYVHQRALWNTREERSAGDQKHADVVTPMGSDFFKMSAKDQQKWRFVLHVDDLHHTMWKWLRSVTPADAIRIVAGGPGSGKSTFARSFAIEAIDSGEVDVLFVPLQEIEATGTFSNRIENLFRNRTDLGLDRTQNPLAWLGQRDTSGGAPQRPLLLICDGLDEIAPPGSNEAATVTADFVQALANWMQAKNSAGLDLRPETSSKFW